MFYVSLSAGEIHIHLAVTTRIQFKCLNIFGFLVPASNGILILNGKSNFNNLTSSTSGHLSLSLRVHVSEIAIAECLLVPTVA